MLDTQQQTWDATGNSPMRNTFGSEDPLQSAAALPYQKLFFPYGFPLILRTNAPEVVAAAERSWSCCTHRFRERAIEIRILTCEGGAEQPIPAPQFRAQGNLMMLIADGGHFGCCDLATGFGFASLTQSTIKDDEYLRYHFLESMAYTLLDTQHMVALHAACVARNGQGLLLAGHSGAGKSSMAYACARRGWTYISDDASSLVLRGEKRTVVGNPRRIRFRPNALSLFPELVGELKNRNGKPTLEVETSALTALRSASECTVHHIIFLNRQTGGPITPYLTRVSRAECFRRIYQNPWPPELDIHRHRMSAVENLIAAPAYELTYKDFNPAVELVNQLIQ